MARALLANKRLLNRPRILIGPHYAVRNEYKRAVDAYRQMGVERAIHILERSPGEDASTIYRELTDSP